MEKSETALKRAQRKRPHLSVYLTPQARSGLEGFAAAERRKLGSLGAVLLEWAIEQLQGIGTTAELLRSVALPGAARVSRETQEELQTALRIILERAPTTIIEDISSRLDEWAHKYGDERKAKR